MIRVGLASVPARRDLLYRTLDSLLPQADRIGVYLNGYEDVPEFCVNPKIDVARSQDHGDIGDIGKFFWADEADAYYLTCDDDLVYRRDYVQTLLDGIERYERSAVVSLHGSIFSLLVQRPMERQVFSCLVPIYGDFSVHTLGTGVMAFHIDTCRPPLGIFDHPNMADIWFGAWAQRERIPLVVIAHREYLVGDLDPADTIWDHCSKGTGSAMDTGERQKEVVRSLAWRIFPPRIPSTRSAANFDAAWYDEVMVEEGSPAMEPLEESPWITPYTELAKMIDRDEEVVDLGCGTGRFIELLYRRGHIAQITGVDWSQTSLDEAAAYISPPADAVPARWICADLYEWEPDPEAGRNTVYVCSEVLEHLDRDLDLIAKIPRGHRFLFTVPNFYDQAHVRVFRRYSDLWDRYDRLLEIRRWVMSGRDHHGIHIAEARRR